MAILARGLDRAEEAVSAHPQDAVAHFAVFCNLGKRLQMKRRAGELFATLGDLGRVKKEEIDRTLALAPDYAAALAAKGECSSRCRDCSGAILERGSACCGAPWRSIPTIRSCA
jgi:hypothetical protein